MHGADLRPTPKKVSATSAQAAALLVHAQGHPLTPAQRVALAEAQGHMTPVQGHQALVRAGVLPHLVKAPNESGWLADLVGLNQMKAFVKHPGVRTGLEAAVSLPLPWTKALDAGAVLGRVGARELPTAAKVALKVSGHGARGAALAGNAAALNNAIQNPNRDNALSALGLMMPLPPEEQQALRRLALAAKGVAATNTAVKSGTLGAGLNAYGSSSVFRNEGDAAILEQYMTPLDRAEALNTAFRPEGEGQQAMPAFLQRLLRSAGPGLVSAVYGGR